MHRVVGVTKGASDDQPVTGPRSKLAVHSGNPLRPLCKGLRGSRASTPSTSSVNLKGLSSTERAQALITLAHPEFRDGLRTAAKEQHLI
jgi:hypothetical protein